MNRLFLSLKLGVDLRNVLTIYKKRAVSVSIILIGIKWVCKCIIGIVSDYFDFFKIKIKANSSVGNDTPHYSDQLNL